MPEVVQTGASVAIDFLSGFGKGMVQNDINRRENEKLNIQKSKWKAEMSALAAQDEFRRLQNENSRLEIDMRKTQLDDVVATREQTKGFVGFMADAVGKAKGNPSEKQASLLEAYTMGAAQFPQADMSLGDKLIDAYAKISGQSGSRKAWKIEDIKDIKTGTKQRAVIGEGGNVINWLPGSKENLEVVNDKVTTAHAEWDAEYNRRMQAIIAGKGMVVGSESGMVNLEGFMNQTAKDDDRTKQERAVDYMFGIRDRVIADMEKDMGTFDLYLNKHLEPVMTDKKTRDKFTSAYRGRPESIKYITSMIEDRPAEDRAEILAQIKNDVDTLVSPEDRTEIMLTLSKLQARALLEMKDISRERMAQKSSEEMSMQETITKDKKQKEQDLLGRFAGGIEGLQVGPKVTSTDWWSSFLGMESGDGDVERDEESENMETLNAMQEPLVKSFKLR